MLAKKLAPIAGKLVEKMLTFSIPGKLIQDNLHLIHYIIVSKLSNKGRTLIHLDQSKAFDWVDSGSRVAGLGWDPDFCSWITALYGGIKSTVQINGYLLVPFSIEHSVHQECSLFPFLYVLALKPLLWRLERFLEGGYCQ